MIQEQPGRGGSAAAPGERAARGREAERIAERYLAAQGVRVLARNVRVRGGELDLVAEDGEEVVFVEVRSRRAGARFDPAATVGSRKMRSLVRAASRWLGANGRGNSPSRFDLVAVSVSRRGFSIRHIRGAFVDEAL